MLLYLANEMFSGELNGSENTSQSGGQWSVGFIE